jgi:hypothetical protein
MESAPETFSFCGGSLIELLLEEGGFRGSGLGERNGGDVIAGGVG